MNKILKIFFLLFLASCGSYHYSEISLKDVSEERKHVAKKFADTILAKCMRKDYSEIMGFNISKRFESRLVPDSLKKACSSIESKYGDIILGELVSVHTLNHPKDYMDVFNFKISTKKNPAISYLHVGMYRDQNYIEVPFYFNKMENYFEYRMKKYIADQKEKK